MIAVNIYLQIGSLMIEIKQSRGRPKKVDEAAVQRAVLNQFWEKGYSGASLSDLSNAAGVSRPSLYELFGDKQAMYLASLGAVSEQLDSAMSAMLSGKAPIAQELTAFFEAAIELYLSGSEPLGCLIMCTAPAEAPGNISIRNELAGVIEKLDIKFEQRFMIAQNLGELPSYPPARALARITTATLQSLALRVRSSADAAAIHAMARETISFLTAIDTKA